MTLDLEVREARGEDASKSNFIPIILQASSLVGSVELRMNICSKPTSARTLW